VRFSAEQLHQERGKGRTHKGREHHRWRDITNTLRPLVAKDRAPLLDGAAFNWYRKLSLDASIKQLPERVVNH
jgi:hypothetical protein